MQSDEENILTNEELLALASKFGFKINESNSKLLLRPLFDLKRKEDAGVLLHLLISIFPLYQLVVNEEIFVKVVMGLVGGFFFVLSILTLIKQHSDFCIAKQGELRFRNSLKATRLNSAEIQELIIRKTNETIKRKNSRGYTVRIVELIAKTQEGDQRVFDFSGEIRFQNELDQLAKYIYILANEKLFTKTDIPLACANPSHSSQ